MIIVAPQFFGKNILAIAIFPFIILKNDKQKHNRQLINHERIHLRQQLEMLILPFYIWYLAEYFVRLLIYRNSYKAYVKISFEQEAYNNDFNLSYLKNRPFFEFLKYL